jgi:hypothetical protein
MNEKVIVTENGRRRRISKFEVIITQLVNKAASGDVRAAREVLKMRADIVANEPDAAEQLVVKIVRFGDLEPQSGK